MLILAPINWQRTCRKSLGRRGRAESDLGYQEFLVEEVLRGSWLLEVSMPSSLHANAPVVVSVLVKRASRMPCINHGTTTGRDANIGIAKTRRIRFVRLSHTASYPHKVRCTDLSSLSKHCVLKNFIRDSP
mmetsp:Transcript_69771/g.226914  ORF Transcript_69771/g.226914 Transcript_69771/m.226914 type:complete len:131 (+) Transcript_69771:2281-2673(+)